MLSMITPDRVSFTGTSNLSFSLRLFKTVTQVFSSYVSKHSVTESRVVFSEHISGFTVSS